MTLIDRVDAIAKRLESFFTGRNAASDPLYLTNRTFGQKVRTGVLIGAPIAAIGVIVYLALAKQFDRPISLERAVAIEAAAKAKQPTGEITAKVLPNIDKTYTSENSKDVDVIEASINRAGEPTLIGKLRNNTENLVRVADLVFDVTDNEGSQLGGVSVRVENIPPRGTAPFRLVLPQREARTALVREVHSR
jgi:hypothetical protein